MKVSAALINGAYGVKARTRDKEPLQSGSADSPHAQLILDHHLSIACIGPTIADHCSAYAIHQKTIANHRCSIVTMLPGYSTIPEATPSYPSTMVGYPDGYWVL